MIFNINKLKSLLQCFVRTIQLMVLEELYRAEVMLENGEIHLEKEIGNHIVVLLAHKYIVDNKINFNSKFKSLNKRNKILESNRMHQENK